MGILERWKLTPDELNEILESRPSLRGITFGYVSEYKLRKLWFSDKRFSQLSTPDDHDRTRKGDFTFIYKDAHISVEAKSLQTRSIKRGDGAVVGKFQCDASDRRAIRLPNGKTIETTCLLVGEFDLLAVNLFEFSQEWRFAFAKNTELPRTRYPKYTPQQRKYLLATLMDISWPPKPPFFDEPFRLLDEIVKRKLGRN
ncbi:MAG: restriction endonuclease [Elusimicrobia bacterium]|nr:restriction endonuclease [Elusimicrobiota bacterium]